jgi:hypothetical protein
MLIVLQNHTITESSFADPCKPIASNLTSEMRPGIKSGFVPVTGTESTTPVYNMLINDTKPIWLYCGQGPHCQKGMSMVINQNDTSGKTIEAYKAAAAQIPLPVAPAAASSVPPVVVATPPAATGIGATTPAGLPPPTPVAGVTTTSPVVAPSVFTGAASRPELNVGSFGGLAVAALVVLL